MRSRWVHGIARLNTFYLFCSTRKKSDLVKSEIPVRFRLTMVLKNLIIISISKPLAESSISNETQLHPIHEKDPVVDDLEL